MRAGACSCVPVIHVAQKSPVPLIQVVENSAEVPVIQVVEEPVEQRSTPLSSLERITANDFADLEVLIADTYY